MTTKKTKKRNPQDITLRNLRALKFQVGRLKLKFDVHRELHELLIKGLRARVNVLEARWEARKK